METFEPVGHPHVPVLRPQQIVQRYRLLSHELHLLCHLGPPLPYLIDGPGQTPPGNLNNSTEPRTLSEEDLPLPFDPLLNRLKNVAHEVELASLPQRTVKTTADGRSGRQT
jgi:hypothetical protein